MQSGTEKLWQAIYQIESKLNRTKGTGTGQPETAAEVRLQDQWTRLKQACSAISGYPGKLCEAAGVYTAAEAKNQNAAGALKRNIL